MAKKKESKLSFETDFETQEENRLKIRPEDVVKLREEFGKLSEEFNPYTADYVIEKPRFIGDEPPYDQFGDGDYRKWEKINDGDPDLSAIIFSLPIPPKDRTLIDNYYLPQDEQYFRRLEIPRKFLLIEQKALQDLADIEKKNRQDTIQGYKYYIRFWELVEQEEKNLVEEIKWLRKYGGGGLTGIGTTMTVNQPFSPLIILISLTSTSSTKPYVILNTEMMYEGSFVMHGILRVAPRRLKI
jgi:hypothetical protein